MARQDMVALENVLRVECDVREDGRMVCRVELKGFPELILDGLEAVHGLGVDGSFYSERKFFFRAPDFQGGQTMSCTNFGGESLNCRT